MLLRTLYNESLAQASYLIGCEATGEALVIDPNRFIDHYIELARSKGLRIAGVTETHIHADFVSGSHELAQRTGAQLYLSDMGPAEWKYAYTAEDGVVLLNDNDTLTIGNILIKALHTPGHTPEHVSFLVTDTASANEPVGLFTGDFLFVGDVGRPDLLERVVGVHGVMEDGARQLFRSLQTIRALPDYLQIWPGHGAGSACGRSLGALSQTTMGYERRWNWAFQVQDEEAFIKDILAGQPEPPSYFAHMKHINQYGPSCITDHAVPPVETVEDLLDHLAHGERVVDMRSAEDYAAGHLSRTINIPLNGSFVAWAGWLLPYDHPFHLIVAPTDIVKVQQELSLIGLEQIAGYLPSDVLRQWVEEGHPLEHLQKRDVVSLYQRMKQGIITVIDVRAVSEYESGHLEGAINIPLGSLEHRLQDVPTHQDVAVYCQAGSRSAIAASILAAHGFTRQSDLLGGFAAWEKTGLPKEKERHTTMSR